MVSRDTSTTADAATVSPSDAGSPAGQELGLCKCCYATDQVKPEQIRPGGTGNPWIDSTLLRCANDGCYAIRVGTMQDRVQHIADVYAYKYFGDYELSPEQLDAVAEAVGYAMLVPELVGALKGAIGALEFSRDYHNDLGNEDQAFAQDMLDAATKAIAKAEGRS